MAPAQDPEFLHEVWALYGVGTACILLRFTVGIRTLGIRGMRWDDGFALVALAAWTYSCVAVQIIYHDGTNAGYTPAEVAQFDERKFHEVVYGSKLFLGSWYA